jgi:hypothetical protein
MTAALLDTTLPQAQATKVPQPEIFYPSLDGEPLAESYDHQILIIQGYCLESNCGLL